MKTVSLLFLISMSTLAHSQTKTSYVSIEGSYLVGFEITIDSNHATLSGYDIVNNDTLYYIAKGTFNELNHINFSSFELVSATDSSRTTFVPFINCYSSIHWTDEKHQINAIGVRHSYASRADKFIFERTKSR